MLTMPIELRTMARTSTRTAGNRPHGPVRRRGDRVQGGAMQRPVQGRGRKAEQIQSEMEELFRALVNRAAEC